MALETFESKGGLQAEHVASTALFGEYAALTGQDKQLKQDVVKFTDGTDKTGAQAEKSTPAQRASQAFEAFQQTGQLTPELKKQFEDAIAESDKGPSSKTAGLEKQFADLEKELERVFPKAKQEEVQKLNKEAEEAFGKLSEEKQQQVGMLLQLRQVLPEESRKEIEDQLKQLAPDVMEKVIKIEQLQAPAIPIVEQLQEVGTALEMEKNHDSMTRLFYGVALLQSGDKDGAKKQITDAAIKNPALAANENFVKLATSLGIDLKSLKK